MASEKSNKSLSIFYFIIAGLGISYDIILLVLNPGTFLDNLTSFTHIWSVLGLIFIFFGVYRLIKGYSFWYDCKKWLKITLVSLLSLGVAISVACLIFIFNPKVVDENSNEPDAEYMILLGGGIDKDGNLPKNVLNRVEVAADYLKKHRNTVCVVTGGTLKWLPVAEAPEIKRQLMLKGIAPGRILVEDQALDTIQNFKYSCQLLANYDGVQKTEILKSNIVVVTNYFHLRRAERLAKRMGFEKISGIGAHCDPITALHLYIREIGAYIKLNFRILFTGEPGNMIPQR